MTRAKATAEGYLWNHAGKVLEYLLLFCTTVVIARGLGVEANGAFVALTSFAQLLVVLSSLSLESSLNRFIPQLEAVGPETGERLRFMLRKVFLLRGGLLAGVVALSFLVVKVLGLAVPGSVDHYFWCLVGYAVVRSLVQLTSTIFVAHLRTAPLAKIAVAVRAVELAGVSGMLMSGMTVASVMLFLTATGMLQIGAGVYANRSDFLGEAEPHSLRSVYAFGAVYWINTILEYFLGKQGDVLFLSALLSSPIPASMYNVAFSVVLAAAQGLTLGLGGVTLTTFSRLAVTSPEKMDRFYAFLVRIVSLLVIPVLVFVFFNARSIVTLLFSPEYAEAALLVQGMIVFRVAARLFAGSENAEYLLARGETLSVVRIGILGAATNVVLDLLLIPRYAAFGAVLGSGCANLLVNFLGSLFVWRAARGPVIQWSYWGVVTLTAVVAGIVTSVLLPGGGWPIVIVRGALFGGATAFLLYLAKPFPAIDVPWASEVNQKFARAFAGFTRQVSDTMSRA